jgi:hypothetical protein
VGGGAAEEGVGIVHAIVIVQRGGKFNSRFEKVRVQPLAGWRVFLMNAVISTNLEGPAFV